MCRHALTSTRIDPRRCREIVEHHLGYDPGAVGHPETQLVVLSGGDAHDRDQVAEDVRRRYGPRCSLVASADLGHVVLGDRDEHVGALVAQVAAFALDAGQHVVCDLPLNSARDRQVLADRIRFSPRARRDLDSLPLPVATAMAELLPGPVAENPHRLGGALRGRWEGYRSARRGGHRAVDRVDDEERQVLVAHIGPRADVYRGG